MPARPTYVTLPSAHQLFAYAVLHLPWVVNQEGFVNVVRGASTILVICFASVCLAIWLWPEPATDLRFTGDSKLYPFAENGRARLRVTVYNDNERELGFHFVIKVLVIPNGFPKSLKGQRENEEKAWKVFVAGDNMGREHDSEELKLAGKSSTAVFFDAGPLSKEKADSMNAKTGAAFFMGAIVPVEPNQRVFEYSATNFGDPEILLSCANHNGAKQP